MTNSSKYLEDNRNRLIKLLENIQGSDIPDGWEKVGGIAISGFIGFGFSKAKPNLALIVTTSGRSVLKCDNCEKISRDHAEYEGFDESGIFCKGISPIENESILLAGQNAGGLPMQTIIGDSLTLVSPEWPQFDLLFCSENGHPLMEKFQATCVKLRRDFIEATGFSWCGNYFAIASSSDFDVWRRKTKL